MTCLQNFALSLSLSLSLSLNLHKKGTDESPYCYYTWNVPPPHFFPIVNCILRKWRKKSVHTHTHKVRDTLLFHVWPSAGPISSLHAWLRSAVSNQKTGNIGSVSRARCQTHNTNGSGVSPHGRGSHLIYNFQRAQI